MKVIICTIHSFPSNWQKENPCSNFFKLYFLEHPCCWVGGGAVKLLTGLTHLQTLTEGPTSGSVTVLTTLFLFTFLFQAAYLEFCVRRVLAGNRWPIATKNRVNLRHKLFTGARAGSREARGQCSSRGQGGKLHMPLHHHPSHLPNPPHSLSSNPPPRPRTRRARTGGEARNPRGSCMERSAS